MDKRKKVLAVIFIIFLFTAISTSAFALECSVPTMGTFFYGDASVNGREVPVGTVITARLSGEVRGQITTTEAGKYGNTGDIKLGVDGCSNESGKMIEFYAKLPGIQEIKAEETSPWGSGETIELDLTFTGNEVPDPQPSSSSSSSGGSSSSGSSSGGGGGAAPPNYNSASYYFDVIKADEQATTALQNSNISIIRLQLILNKEVSGVSFKFESTDDPDVEKMDGVYQYIEITAPKITDDMVKTAILRFKVANEWFDNYDPEKVALWRYHDGEWVELQTIPEGSDTTAHQYRAATPGFSYFAIKSEEKEEETGQESPEEDEEESEEEENSDSITGGMVAVPGGANPAIGIAIIAGIVLIGTAVFLTYSKMKGRGKK